MLSPKLQLRCTFHKATILTINKTLAPSLEGGHLMPCNRNIQIKEYTVELNDE